MRKARGHDQAARSVAGLRAYLLEALRLFVSVGRWFDSEGFGG